MLLLVLAFFSSILHKLNDHVSWSSRSNIFPASHKEWTNLQPASPAVEFCIWLCSKWLRLLIFLCCCLWLQLRFFFFFLGPHLWHMEVPRPGMKSELQLPAYTTLWIRAASVTYVTAQDNVWILNPLSKARKRTHILTDASRIRFQEATMGTPATQIFNWKPRMSSLLKGPWLLGDLYCKTAAMYHSVTSGVSPASHLQPQRACHFWPGHPIPTGVAHRIFFLCRSPLCWSHVYFYRHRKKNILTQFLACWHNQGVRWEGSKGRREEKRIALDLLLVQYIKSTV